VQLNPPPASPGWQWKPAMTGGHEYPARHPKCVASSWQWKLLGHWHW